MNPEHILFAILFAVLLIYGPNNLPKLGSALGKTVKNVRDGMEGAGEEPLIEDMDEDEDAVSEKPAA